MTGGEVKRVRARWVTVEVGWGELDPIRTVVFLNRSVQCRCASVMGLLSVVDQRSVRKSIVGKV